MSERRRKVSKAELKEICAEQKYWRELANLVGWRVLGWTGKSHACYVTDKDVYNGTIEMTGRQRDSIMAAISRATR